MDIELIAAENFVSSAVLAASGSIMTNKYAEGYPGARYYAGCEYMDIAETLAIERAKQIFGAEHSGAPYPAARDMATVPTLRRGPRSAWRVYMVRGSLVERAPHARLRETGWKCR